MDFAGRVGLEFKAAKAATYGSAHIAVKLINSALVRIV
jgi:hypothetical protein